MGLLLHIQGCKCAGFRSEGRPVSNPAGEAVPAEAMPTFKEFLETSPPDVEVIVTKRTSGPYHGGGSGGIFFRLFKPELDLYCETCDGTRTFKCTNEYGTVLNHGAVFEELNYECKNCKDGKRFRKRFCLTIFGEGEQGAVQKIGEYPAYNPVTSRKVYDLIGENHRELFLKGRRAELRGLGIGAFAYYRRIVDDQKDMIIDRLEQVAKRLGASEDALGVFASARAQDQFTSAIKEIKDALPSALFIAGHNPLTILYDVLSDGIHDLSDEECLTYARTVRTLLIALADRISEILKDEAKVAEAIGVFLTRKQKKQ
jgi:hypothetical protein